MTFTRLAPLLLLAAPFAFGQKKEIVELQRDIALLQDQVRTLQSAFTEKVASLTVLLEQSLDRINKANTAVAVLESSLRDRMSAQEKGLTGPIANVGSKVDQMAEEFRFVKESMADLNSRMQKLQAQLTDVKNAVTTLPSPAAPPAGPPGAGASGGPPAGMSADGLYQDALRDYQSGKFDIAMAEFSDYLRYYGSTDLAANAQYYVGMIYYNREDWDAARTNFDLVLEKYPDNNKTLDAQYMKGMSLLRGGQRTAAAQEFRELVAKSPSGELSQKARGELKKMGLSAAPASSRKKK
ncbi:MAG: tetratricopeptide repeat protein [Bryobacteraceae bacterium]|nr:tetratricopeptide repeat protein [Bryobacteraceae bacterium]